MATPQPQPDVVTPGAGFVARLSSYAANALRYWEPRRLVYNTVLAVVVLGHFVVAWPGSRDKLSFDLTLGIFFLAVLANVVYCAAYIADLFVRFAGLHEAWKRGRALLLTIGTLFAGTIAHFFAKGLFGE